MFEGFGPVETRSTKWTCCLTYQDVNLALQRKMLFNACRDETDVQQSTLRLVTPPLKSFSVESLGCHVTYRPGCCHFAHMMPPQQAMLHLDDTGISMGIIFTAILPWAINSFLASHTLSASHRRTDALRSSCRPRNATGRRRWLEVTE